MFLTIIWSSAPSNFHKSLLSFHMHDWFSVFGEATWSVQCCGDSFKKQGSFCPMQQRTSGSLERVDLTNTNKIRFYSFWVSSIVCSFRFKSDLRVFWEWNHLAMPQCKTWGFAGRYESWESGFVFHYSFAMHSLTSKNPMAMHQGRRCGHAIMMKSLCCCMRGHASETSAYICIAVHAFCFSERQDWTEATKQWLSCCRCRCC